MLEIIDNNWHLFRNNYEATDLTSLRRIFYRYQRHIAAYRGLRAIGDSRNTPDLKPDPDTGEDYQYPQGFSKAIDARIIDLENQYKSLLREL